MHRKEKQGTVSILAGKDFASSFRSFENLESFFFFLPMATCFEMDNIVVMTFFVVLYRQVCWLRVFSNFKR